MSTATFSTVQRNSTPFYPAGLAKYLPTNFKFESLQSMKKNRKDSSPVSECDSVASLTTMDSNCGDSRGSPVTSFVNISTRSSIMMPQQEQQDDVLFNVAKLNKKKNVDDTKYKTELCKKYEMTGHCPYFAKCRFAHGREELNFKAISSKKTFKAKQCKNFHSVMNCPYGSRCMFGHEQRTVEELRVYYNQSTVTYTEVKQSGLLGSKRMNAFSKIAEDETLSNRSELVKAMTKEVNRECDEILGLCYVN